MTPRALAVVGRFAWRYVPQKWEKIQGTNRFRKVPDKDKAYFFSTKDREEIRLHINDLPAFKESLELNFLKGDLVTWSEAPLLPSPDAEHDMKPEWAPRGDQPAIIEYLLDPQAASSKLVEVQMGAGKSFVTMEAQKHKGGIGIFVMTPKYIPKWLIDLRKTFNLEVGDIITAEGSEELMALLELAAQEGTASYKWVIISNRTLQIFYKHYQEMGKDVLDLGYACLPHQLFQHLKGRTRILDEVHENFHFNYLIDCNTHVEDSISLSATTKFDDDFKNAMFQVAYPKSTHFKGIPYDKYITGRAVMYSLNDPSKIRFNSRGRSSYSHIVFEQSLMKNRQVVENYMQMINMIMRGTFLRNDFYKPGDKCILFFASIDMCTIATEWFKKEYPNMSVSRYVEEDPYENLMGADIRCTTLMSAGTGVDVPGLTTNILTTAIRSSQSNTQGMGRLRKLPDGRAPIFAWLVCQDVPKHIEYHNHRKELLEPLMIGYRSDQIGILV